MPPCATPECDERLVEETIPGCNPSYEEAGPCATLEYDEAAS